MKCFLRGQALLVGPFTQVLDGARFDVSVNADVGHSVVFHRSGVATRKTTWAEHLARQFDKYVMVPFTGAGKLAAGDCGSHREAMGQTIKNKDDLAFRNALKLAANESLTLFATRRTRFLRHQKICAQRSSRATQSIDQSFCYFSASGDASVSENLTASTAGEITQKFMWAPLFTRTS